MNHENSANACPKSLTKVEEGAGTTVFEPIAEKHDPIRAMISLPDLRTIQEWDKTIMMAIEYFKASEKTITAIELQMALKDISDIRDAYESASSGNHAKLSLRSLAFVSLVIRDSASELSGRKLYTLARELNVIHSRIATLETAAVREYGGSP